MFGIKKEAKRYCALKLEMFLLGRNLPLIGLELKTDSLFIFVARVSGITKPLAAIIGNISNKGL